MFLNVNIFVEANIVSKWYALIAGAIACAMLMLFCKGWNFRMDKLSLLVSVLIGYMIARGLFSGMPVVKAALFVSFLLLYIFFRAVRLQPRVISTIIVSVCVLQAVYGMLQACGIVPVTGIFTVSGSFDNPAGFAASLAAGFPFCLEMAGGASRRFRYAGIASAVIIATAIVMAESRAGVLAIAVCLLFWLFMKYKHKVRHIRPYIVTGALLLVAVGTLLFFLKKESASGRLLIWNNSVSMVADAPLAGHGPGSFIAEYMPYQAAYFGRHPGSVFSQLADNVTHPFNEYLLLAVEYGVLGVLIVGCIIAAVIIAGRKENTTELSALLSVAVFACFSYPLRYAFVIAVVAYCLGGIRAGGEAVFRKGIVPKISVAVLAVLCAVFLVKDISFEYRWGWLAKKVPYGNDRTLENYRNLYERWNGNPYFLYNYGAVLKNNGSYDGGIGVFSECARHLNDYDVQMMLGDCYAQTRRHELAERHYLAACRMIPNRFMPLGRLMDLYGEYGETEKAVEIAKIVIGKRVKVPSASVDMVIREAKRLIEQSGTE